MSQADTLATPATGKKLSGRHAGKAKTWTYSHGVTPHIVYARELGLGGKIQVRYTDPSKKGRDKRPRKHLDMRVRSAPDADVDNRLAKRVRDTIIAINARLVAGLEPLGDTHSTPAPQPTGQGGTSQETLTLLEGFTLALDPETGKYASVETRRYRDMEKLRDILFSPGMLDGTLTWAELRYGHVVGVWRRMASIHKKDPARFGLRRAEVVVDALYSVASWLRRREHIPSNAAFPVKGWRSELAQEWQEKTEKPSTVNQPRHSVQEARAIFGSLWNRERLRYRELLRVTGGGGQFPLQAATREHIVRDHAGRPVALRLRVLREHRNGKTEPVSVRVSLDDRARAALAEVDHESAPKDAPLFDAPPRVLEVDPRIELALELGAEMRLGQVGEARRSQLDLTRTPNAPHGTFTVYGKKKKTGEKLALTEEQREAMDRSLGTVLAHAEAAYEPRDPQTDYYLLPCGKLPHGRATVERARRAPITRDALLKQFHDLERAAGITPVRGRGWYGLRRVATDVAPAFTNDRRVLDKLGGWTAGSTTREDTYQDREDELLLAETAAVRRAWRSGRNASADSIPASSETLLALLPDALRAAVLGHFAQRPANAVGTAVGTNDDAAGIRDSDGVVSR